MSIKSLKKVLGLSIFLIISPHTSYCQLVINELFLTNGSLDLNTSTYNYPEWIEIINNSAEPTNTGSYFLSNDSLNLKKWQLPSFNLSGGNYRVYYFSTLGTNYYTNFKADADGGSIFLSNATGEIVDRVYYGKQHYNVSYGRYPNATGNFHFLLTPTRNAENSAETSNQKSSRVFFRKEGGFYNSSISLEMFFTIGYGKIYYTLDGSEPNKNSTIYSKPLTISKTTVVRARVIEENDIPGDITTHTFFINERIPKLPVMSLVTDPKNLFDNRIGIYVTGTNGITGNCSDSPQNWNRDWERSANFELFDFSKEQVVNQMLGIKIAGGCSRENPQKALAINARSKYGKDRINYQFFQDRPFSNFNSILLRTAANDFYNSQIRDLVFQSLTHRFMNQDHQAARPAVIFINGEYYGIQHMYERSGKDLVEASYGLDEGDIDMGEGPGDALEGNTADYQRMMDFIYSNDLSREENYKKVAAQIDIDNYIEYLILQMFIGNHDWPGNNCKFWRRNDPKGKWRWILFDTDFGFGMYSDVYDNTVQLMLNPNGPYWPNPEWSTRLFRKLIENPEFKKTFLNRFYAHLNTSFKPELVKKSIDSIAAMVREEIPYHFERYSLYTDWEGRLQDLRNSADLRPGIVRTHLQALTGTPVEVEVQCKSISKAYGFLSVDHVTTKDTAYKGIFPQGSVLNIEFVPEPGYIFDKAIRKTYNAGISNFIVPNDSWKYNDSDPSLLLQQWKDSTFDDGSWKTGTSQFGYGEGDENTIVSYGDDVNNKFITSYYRKTFIYDTSMHYFDHRLIMMVDDGAVVYLNGIEIVRKNLPSGEINYQTLADGAVENIYDTFDIPGSFFVHGNNTIAVEVHQTNATSSDLSFDLQLNAQYSGGESPGIELTQNNFIDTINANVSYEVYYKPIAPISKLIINEIAPRNKLYSDEYGENDDWLEIYNNGNDSVDISGLFITDSVEIPLMHRIQNWKREKIKIAPGEYKIIWADKQVKQGPLHVNFKLDAGGEEIALFQKVGESVLLIDSATFNLRKNHKSTGRIPNITGNFKNLYHATPMAENLDLPYTEIENIINSSQFVRVWFRQNDKNLILELASNDFSASVLQVIDMTGRILLSKNLKTSYYEINLNTMQSGIYLIRVQNDNSQQVSKIFIK